MQPHGGQSTPPRILVIDDEQALAKILAATFADAGFDVVVAFDAVGGLARVREQTPSIILVDLAMPGMDGYGFIDGCRALPTCKDTPIILATATGDLANVRRRVEDKGVVLISKPFDLETLIASVVDLARFRRPDTR